MQVPSRMPDYPWRVFRSLLQGEAFVYQGAYCLKTGDGSAVNLDTGVPIELDLEAQTQAPLPNTAGFSLTF